jgi:N-acyl-D-aspartate/D-glutamate deacylase
MNAKLTRKQFLQAALWGGVSAARVPALVAPHGLGTWQVSGPALDIVIRGGRVIDGTGRAPFDASIGLRGGVIADIGAIPDSAARQVIDAKGEFVCPGFIDPHAHEEILMVADPVLEKFVRQGVTTIINGNCGHSVTPYRATTVLEYWYREALISKKRSLMKVDWEGVDGYARVIAGVGATINSAVLLGYGGIRWGAMRGGHDRPPTSDEWKEIERLVATGLEQGALGMSTGLAYRPCFYAKTDELIRVAQVLATHDKVYASHLRNGPNGAAEAIAIGEKAGCRVQLSHFRNAKSALALVTDANRRGIVTCADIIPQSTSHRRASNRMLEALMVFYPGVFDADDETLKSLVRNPKTRAEITKTIQFFNNDKNDVIIVRALTPKHEASVGRSIAELAKAAGKDPNDYYVEVILDEGNPVVFAFDGDRREARTQAGGRGPQQNPADQVPFGFWTTHERFGPGSDSIPVDQDEPFGWYEHQRRGAFPGYFRQASGHNVPLERAVQRATAVPAEQFRIKDRGVLAKGKVADIVVFNPSDYSYPTPAESDPNDPHPVAKGVRHVVVNGVPVLVDGKLTKQRPGKVLI